MDRDDPQQAADRHARTAVMAIFAVILAVAIIAAFITTIEGVDTKQAATSRSPERLAWPVPIRRSIELRESLFEISSPPPL
jgi:hypothetical protein